MSRRFEKWFARTEAILIGAGVVLVAIAYVISRLSR
jgi:L-2-hydroxyglutarate oxidase LhgO